MNTFSKIDTPFARIDMAEVTRLTRLGKLAEAVALLQGRATPGSTHDKAEAQTTPSPAGGMIIDLAPPSARGGVWTAPGENASASASPPAPAGSPNPADAMRTFRTRFSVPGGAAFKPGRAAPRVPDGARFEERTFFGSAGARTYKVYVPSGYTGQALPVVVMLHGCTQNPDDCAAGTGMNDLAEEQTFLVVYPGQSKSANMQGCWNWFNPRDQMRDAGEPSLIAGIARAVVAEFSADPTRVYVAGLSAGGAMAAVMADTYPDVFAAVGVHSGIACGTATDMPSALAAMRGGGTPRPRDNRPAVPTIVFHGDRDKTVASGNADSVIARARSGYALTPTVTRGTTSDGVGWTRTVHRDGAGQETLEQWVVHGGGHAWFGGNAAGSYTDARGPDASRAMMRFFLGHATTDSTSTR